MIRDVLRMGDPRLLERSREVQRFGTRELDALLDDMRDTMRAQIAALEKRIAVLEANLDGA